MIDLLNNNKPIEPDYLIQINGDVIRLGDWRFIAEEIVAWGSVLMGPEVAAVNVVISGSLPIQVYRGCKSIAAEICNELDMILAGAEGDDEEE